MSGAIWRIPNITATARRRSCCSICRSRTAPTPRVSWRRSMRAIARIKPRSSRRCAPRTARRSRSGRSIWPHSKQIGTKRACYSRPVLVYYIGNPDGVVAQLVRAFASHARGRGFEPRQPHQKALTFVSAFLLPYCNLFSHSFIPRSVQNFRDNPVQECKNRRTAFSLCGGDFFTCTDHPA